VTPCPNSDALPQTMTPCLHSSAFLLFPLSLMEFPFAVSCYCFVHPMQSDINKGNSYVLLCIVILRRHCTYHAE